MRYSQTDGEYRSKTDSYGKFWTNSGNEEKQSLSGWGLYNKITNNRYEQYISGLQYAVEKAAELNKIKKDSVVVSMLVLSALQSVVGKQLKMLTSMVLASSVHYLTVSKFI